MLASDAGLHEVIEHIALHQQLSVESHATLNGNISVELISLPLPRVLKRLLRDYNFTLHLDGATDQHRLGGLAGKLWILPRHPHAAGFDTPADYFGRQGPDDPGWALQRIAARSDATRLDAVSVLTAFAGDEAFTALAAAVYDPDPKVRLEAVAGLGRSSNPAARALLEQSLLDADASVRGSALQSVVERAESGDVAALSLLAVPLQDPVERVRASVVDSLADIEDAQATALLHRAMLDKSPRISAAAAEYLAER